MNGIVPRTNAHHSRRGQAGLIVVLTMTLMFSVLGLTVDLGWAYYKRHAAQAAADAAALSAAVWATQHGMACGAAGLVCGTVTSCAYPNVTTPTNALQEACLYAQANGFVNNGSQTVSVQANTTTPPGVSGNSPAFWVQVNVSESPFNLFGNFAGMHAFNVNASALAGVTAKPAANTVVILSPSAPGALTMGGTSSLSISGGGLYVNSTSSSAIDMSGGASVTASVVDVDGSAKLKGSASTSPTATSTGTTVPNPLAGVSMPSFSGCDHNGYNASGGDVLSPGVYCGGITVGNVAITLKPGNYILNGGGLSISSGTVTSVAATDGTTGVTFFSTGNSTYPAKGLSLTSSATVNVTAPTSGTYRGLVYFEDPSASVTFTGQDSMGASATLNAAGTVYFSQLPFVTSAGATLSSNTSVVALTWSLGGNASLTNDTTGRSALTGISTALIN